MPFYFEYEAPAEELFEGTIHRMLTPQLAGDAALKATFVVTSKQLDWKNAASTIISGITAATEFQSTPAFLLAIGTVVVACLSPLQLHLISDEAAELLTIIERQARHRTLNFRRMQELLGVGAAREAIRALEKAGLVRQETSGDWVIQRIRLTSFRVL